MMKEGNVCKKDGAVLDPSIGVHHVASARPSP